MSKAYRKYTHFTMRFPDFLNDFIRKECYEMGVSKQEFIRAIVRSHLSKKVRQRRIFGFERNKRTNKK